MTGRNIFNGMGIDPDNYAILNIATTSVKAPIGIMEFSGSFGKDTFQYFTYSDDVLIPSDLNYKYTNIDRADYDGQLMEPAEVVSAILEEFDMCNPDVVLYNTASWVRRVAKDKCNAAFFPIFAKLGRAPVVFSMLDYERARVRAGYIMQDTSGCEYWSDAEEQLRASLRGAPRVSGITLPSIYKERGGPDDLDEELTTAQLNTIAMDYIWNTMLINEEAQERTVNNREE